MKKSENYVIDLNMNFVRPQSARMLNKTFTNEQAFPKSKFLSGGRDLVGQPVYI